MSDTIAIIGANLAGGRCALALRSEGYDGRIHLIGQEAYPPYERPALSKGVLAGTETPESTYIVPEQRWTELDIDLQLGSTVTGIDLNRHRVMIDGRGELIADRVILCTGGRARRLDLPGGQLEGVHYLRTIEDSLFIRERIVEGGPVVVIGGGFIGAEVAATASKLGCAVTMLEAGDVPLSRVLGPALGAVMAHFHSEHGVRVLTNTVATSMEGNGSVTRVITSTGEVIEATLVVIGIGMEPAGELAAAAGATTIDGGVVVNEFSETSVPNLYAVGDVANQMNPYLGERLRIESWQNAQNQAAAVARVLVGKREPFSDVPWYWSDQYDLNIQVAGHSKVDDEVIFRGDTASDSFTAFFVRESRLAAAVGVNRARDVRGAIRIIEQGVEVTAAELRDESIDLRRMASAASR